MFRPLELFIGLRYTRAKRRNHFISFISLVSMLCIAVGMIALITVISVMNGFEKQLRDSILGMVAHATDFERRREASATGARAVEAARRRSARAWRRAVHFEPGASAGHARATARSSSGILPDEEPKVSDIGSKMIRGRLDDLKPGAFGMILGNELAMQLGVGVGDKVTVYTSEINVTPVGGVARFKRFDVVGIFSVGFQEYDEGLALVHMDDAERLFQTDGPSGIRLKLDDMFQAWPIDARACRQISAGSTASRPGSRATRISSARCRWKRWSCSSSCR